MKQILISTVFLLGVVISNAQVKLTVNNQSMEKKSSTVRLIYPQWQGARVADQIPELKDNLENSLTIAPLRSL